MARRSGATIQEELYSTPEEPAREELGDVRLIDLDVEKESPFLRAQKRVSVRRTALPKKTATRLLWAVVAIAVAAVTAVSAATIYLATGNESWLWAAVPGCLGSSFLLFAVARLQKPMEP